MSLLFAGPLAAQIQAGRWDQPSDVPEGWVVHNSRHYQIQSQCGIEKAERLAEFMELMFGVYVDLFRPDKSISSKRYPIKLFSSKQLFMVYGRVGESTAAYFNRTAGEMVCYDTGRWMEVEGAEETDPEEPITQGGDEEASRRAELRYKMDLLGTAAHEGWHQYFAWYVGSWVELPSWLNEGMGDYFYAARPMQEGRRLKVGCGRLNDARLPIIKWAVENDRSVPIPQFIRYGQREYYSNAGICYAQGWALCQFLMHSGNRKYAQVIPVFVRLVRSDTNMEDVTERAFRGIDLEELDTEFKEWVRELELPEDEGPIQVRRG